MFTGIVEEVGRIADRAGNRLWIRAERVVGDLGVGSSIAVDGVCLTVVDLRPPAFAVDLSPATLHRTTLGLRQPGDPVNLERPLLATGRVGGHFVQGHVDGVGQVVGLRREGESAWMELTAPPEVARYLVPRGSVAVDGVSLTVADAGEEAFSVCLIPYTLRHTTLGERRPGDPVNLEADILAKYVEQLLRAWRERG
ncbi:MAG: riboflavin synthase [Armatimonadota bacterium]|nr:riboflavin synthase [Armatimonadota bacterium]MDR7444726.1 riboflavin synthase [Armatimonadota bacterium]MDR7570883.1 riboflavin synthase [Armatimonadota bacterium]MDR7613269.1 riboflavin synthase [Armatimonadota bacterium]